MFTPRFFIFIFVSILCHFINSIRIHHCIIVIIAHAQIRLFVNTDIVTSLGNLASGQSTQDCA